MTNKSHTRYQIGDKIGGRYLVHQALMGGMGEVYLCLDMEDNTPYALKTFQQRYDTRELRQHFFAEVENWVALEKHPNIVRCFHADIVANQPFMFLEWIASNESEGTDLRSWLRRGPLDLRLALDFTIDICRGLRHAQEKIPGIVHRDLKPDNVLVNQSRQAKITDFGLAKVVRESGLEIEPDTDESRSHLSNQGGTPLYMAPEQWTGAELDPRTDLYAVGCILYEVLAGQPPYIAPTLAELQWMHREDPIPRLNGLFPDTMNTIVCRCLAKERDDRFASTDELLVALTDIYEIEFRETPRTEERGEKFTDADYNNRGVTYQNIGQPERAIADFDHSLTLNPSNEYAYSNRGVSYADLREQERAIADFTRALELDPNLKKAYFNRGGSYAALGQHQRAIADLDRALRLDPNYKEAYNNRGMNYTTLGQHKQAIADFNRALALAPNAKEAYNNRGGSYAALGQHQWAIADFDRALSLDPNYKETYFNRGSSYSALGQHQRAIADLDRALVLDPNLKLAYFNRGVSYAALGQHQRAIADLDRALALDPNFKEAYYSRGNFNMALGQHERAIADFDLALALDPNYKEAYNNRGLSYNELGQPEKAISDLQRALVLDPNLKLAYFNRGNSYAALGRYQQAIADYDHALTLDPNFKEARFNKGAALANAGRLQEAMPYFEKAAQLGHPQAAQAIAQIRQRGMPVVQPDAAQAAFEAFRLADSLDRMRDVTIQHTLLLNPKMIEAIAQIILQEIPPHLKPEFEQHLTWLRQIANEPKG